MNSRHREKLETRIGYSFSDPELLERSLTHGSYGDGRRSYSDNERLEFLGDRVLGLLTAELLFRSSNDAEGQLARRLNALVKKDTCAKVARDLELGEFLRLSKSEEKQGGREKISILGDAIEAMIAAIYLDGGLAAARDFFNRHWQKPIDEILNATAKDPKTELQELAARMGLSVPSYEVLDRKGPDHNPHFTVQVTIDETRNSIGEGKSKKAAQRLAARNLLSVIKEAQNG